MKNADYAGLEQRLTQAINRKPVPVRYYIYDPEAVTESGERGDIVECTEAEFVTYPGIMTYERHTVYANGVDQICLTKMPTL